MPSTAGYWEYPAEWRAAQLCARRATAVGLGTQPVGQTSSCLANPTGFKTCGLRRNEMDGRSVPVSGPRTMEALRGPTKARQDLKWWISKWRTVLRGGWNGRASVG